MPNPESAAPLDSLPTTDVEAAKEGESQSTAARLFKAQGRRVRNFLRWRLRSEEDAQDASQEVFLRLWRKEKDGALHDEATSYLVAAIYNAAVDTERRRTSHCFDDRVPIDDLELPSSELDAAETLYWRRAVDHLVDVLNELPEMTREVFALSHVDGLTHVAIADRLDMSVRNVERHMARALAHCESRMKEYLG